MADGRWPMFGGDYGDLIAGIIVEMGSFSLSTSVRAVAMKEEHIDGTTCCCR